MRTTAIGLICLLWMSLASAQSYRATIDQRVSNNELVVDLLLETTSGPSDELGNATITLTFNDEAIVFLSKDADYDGLWDRDYSPSYLDIRTEVHAPSLTIHIIRTETGNGVIIPTTPTRLCRLIFEIKNRDAVSGIQWDTGHATSVSDWQGNPIKYKFVWVAPPTFPLPVELSSLSARSENGTILIEWITESETDNLGFQIYRSTTAEGPWHLITPEIIPGSGNSNSQRVYQYTDRSAQSGATYYYRLVDINSAGEQSIHSAISATLHHPETVALAQNYPNPFNPETRIRFSLPKAGQTELSIYNIQGERVRTLVSSRLEAGIHTVRWDRRDDSGRSVSSGIYFYSLDTSETRVSKKMTVLH